MNESDPSWARRQVWVAKINALDTVDEFDTLTQAEAYRDQLTAADETGRVYKVQEVASEE
jgi:hypothetical protein